MHKIFIIIGLITMFCLPAQAQYSASSKAQHLAVLKAVVNYKINDEERINDIEKLRENRVFVEKVQKMLDKLKNTRTKDATNRRVLQILENAGNELTKLLD